MQLNNLVLANVRTRWPALGRLQKVMALKFRNPIRPRDEVSIVLERTTANRVGFVIRRDSRLMSSGALVFAEAGAGGDGGGGGAGPPPAAEGRAG